MSINDADSSSYTPIQCQVYDQIEIACMHHYLLDIELITGEIIRATAKTTQIYNKQEFLVISFEKELVNTSETHRVSENKTIQNSLQNPRQGNEQSIRLDLIKSITALDKNAKFKTVMIN